MISSKKAAFKIIDLTHDLTPIELEEVVTPPAEEVEKSSEIKTSTEEVIKPSKVTEESIEKLKELSVEKLEEIEVKEKEISKTAPEEVIAEKSSVEDSTEIKSLSSEIESKTVPEDVVGEIQEIESQDIIETFDESEEELKKELDVPTESVKEKEPESIIPVIKPPIAFPKLEKVVKVPDDEAERADLILKIYESIFRAMSIGASKIMGVAPARGLTRKFLPVEECRKLLDGVDVKNNSTIDFDKIRENAEKIPISEREKSFKDNFAKIITIITENYGKVMGYAAFRGMVRPEFKIIIESYGPVIDELGIKEQIHPELRDLFK